MNLRTWYDDTYCHDKRAETRIPDLVLDYAAALGFGGGPGSLGDPVRIRFQASGDPLVASNWAIVTSEASISNPQTTNGFTWFYAADVS